MKKNVLLLINGFGVETAQSASIYSKELMPNLDKLTFDGAFLQLKNDFLEYKAAYRNFSMGINDPLTYTLVENSIFAMEPTSNKLLKYLENQLNTHEGSKLHIVCYWDSDKTIEHLGTYVKEIMTHLNPNIHIIIHVVLCQQSILEYKYIERGLSTISYEFGNSVKLGVVTGENNLSDKVAYQEIVKELMTEYGEKWKDVVKKVQVLTKEKTPPCNVRTFAGGYGFRLEDNDQILFFNYSTVDLTQFNNGIRNQKFRSINYDSLQYYSLFPLKCDGVQVPFMYNFAVSSNCTTANLTKIGASCIVFEEKDKCSYINYFLCGLKNEVNENIKFLPTDDGFIYDPDKLVSNIKAQNKELTIINYDITKAKTVEELKETLGKIDIAIGAVDKYCRENKIGLFITSFYGMSTEMYNAKQELCVIDFYGKVPLIIYDEDLKLSEYSIDDGPLYELGNTLLWNINHSYDDMGLVKKKLKLFSFLSKKPKKKETTPNETTSA